MKEGKVIFVGAGPGDPDLITRKGLKALGQADVVLYDALSPIALLEDVPGSAEKIAVGKRAGCHSKIQEEINEILVDRAKKGKIVVRLKGGDPFLFGRGAEECLALQAEGIFWELIPGVSSGTAVPLQAGIPLTHRGLASSVTFLQGHKLPVLESEILRWKGLVQGSDTLVFFMACKNLQQLVSKLQEWGKLSDTPCALVSKGCTPQQMVLRSTLEMVCSESEQDNLLTPALFLVGTVSAFQLSE